MLAGGISALLLLGPVARAEVTPTGVWQLVEARDASGIRYDGSLEIQPVRDAYRVSWATSDGDFQGVGLVHRRWLVVGWGPGDSCGVGLYHLRRDGSVWARWTDPHAQGRLGSEMGRAEDGSTDRYVTWGTTPVESAPYQGTLTLRRGEGPDRRVWFLEWEVMGDVYQGVGLRRGGRIAVAWGPPEASGLATYRIGRRRLKGRWVLVGSTGIGVERARRLPGEGSTVQAHSQDSSARGYGPPVAGRVP